MNHTILGTSLLSFYYGTAAVIFFTLAHLSSIPFSSNRKSKFNSLRRKPGYAFMVNLRSNVGRD